jgi:predicted kinase
MRGESRRATGTPFLILDCNAPQAVIESWLALRQANKNDPSDATLKVIEAQQASREPLTPKKFSQQARRDQRKRNTGHRGGADSSTLASL